MFNSNIKKWIPGIYGLKLLMSFINGNSFDVASNISCRLLFMNSCILGISFHSYIMFWSKIQFFHVETTVILIHSRTNALTMNVMPEIDRFCTTPYFDKHMQCLSFIIWIPNLPGGSKSWSSKNIPLSFDVEALLLAPNF